MLGDSCERLAEIPDESVDLSVYSRRSRRCSPTRRAPRPRQQRHPRGVPRALRLHHPREPAVTKPGRIACVHVQQLTTTKATTATRRADRLPRRRHPRLPGCGWIFHGEVTVDKDPQAQAIRTKAQALMFVTKNRDSAMTRPALADYLLLFRKPGDNPSRSRTTSPTRSGSSGPGRSGWDIKETNTLNARVARDDADERHICPLQLDFIERCVRLWSNPGETVLTPFAGIGSEVYVAVKLGRALGIELKPSYWRTAVANLRELEAEMALPSLFDLEAAS
jgi:hypothetical protein